MDDWLGKFSCFHRQRSQYACVAVSVTVEAGNNLVFFKQFNDRFMTDVGACVDAALKGFVKLEVHLRERPAIDVGGVVVLAPKSSCPLPIIFDFIGLHW